MSNYVDYDNAVELFTEVGNKRKASESMQESLLKSTVGWTGKNKFSDILLGYRLFGNESEGYGIVSITNGYVAIGKVEKNKNYIVSKKSGSGNRFTVALFKDYPTTTASAGRSTQLVADTSLNTYSFNSGDYEYVVLEANRTDAYSDIEPMLRDASITDDTYEPYHESVEDWYWKNNAKTGVHNLMPILAKTSKTVQNINYSYSNDTVSLSGTTSGTGWIWLNNNTNADASNIPFKEGTYRVKVIGTLVDEAYTIQILDANNNQLYISHQDGNEHEFTIANDINIRYGIYFRASGEVATSSFKIMICLAEDTYEDYTSPAMTNRELTDAVTPLASGILPQLMFSGRYGGTTDKAINIDTIHKPFGYMMNINTGSYFSGTAPTDVGNSFMLIGFSSIVAGGVEFGAQLAFGWSANKIAFRKAGYSAQGTTWDAWKYLTIS